MTEPEFTHTPLSRAGVFLDWLFGVSTTTITHGPFKTRYLTLQTDDEEYPRATISCQRWVYYTQYKRWWIPNTHRTTYTVTISVDDKLRDRYGDETFAPAIYPLLCSRLLQWTTYPHICAIEVYAEHLYQRLQRLRGELPPRHQSILL